MKRIITSLCLLGIVILIMSSSGGYPGACGSPSEGDCTGCHNSYALNSGPGSVSITTNIPVSGYVPSQVYSVSVIVAQTGTPLFGFALEALSPSNNSAGTLASVNSETQVSIAGNGRQNILHTSGAGLTNNSHTFTFNWTAPASSVGNVTFYVAGNAANGNGSSSSDFIYTSSATVPVTPLITSTISGSPFCAGQTGISIPYAAGNIFVPGNVFTAELSDATGSFASPTILGTVSSTSSGTIVSTNPIPNAAGTQYRIRVVASNPGTTGTVNSANLTVALPPTVSNAGTDQSLCTNSTSLSANVPTSGTGLWTLVQGSGSISNASSASTTVTSLGTGQNKFVWTITNSSCTPSRDTVLIVVNPSPTTANAGADQNVCFTTANLAANTASAGTGLWSVVSSSATIANPTNPATTVSGLNAGANIFRWTITNGPCNSFDEVTINKIGSISVANAGPDQTLCASTGTLAGNTPAFGTGSWTLVSGSGTATNPNNPASAVTGLGIGANVFRWTITNLTCTPTVDDVTINVNANPTVANAGPDQSVCATSVTMAANGAVIGNGNWTLVNGSGTIVSPASPTTVITGLGAGANTFVWTISNLPCASTTDTVVINQSGNLTAANAGSDQTICGTNANLAGNTPSFGTGQWSLVSGTGTITNPLNPSSTITNLGQGNTVLAWSISNAACPSSIDFVTITAAYPPTVSNAGTNQTICNTITSMNANTPTDGTGNWSVVSGSGIFTSATNPSTTVTSIGNGTNVYRWTISNPPCTASFSDVTVDNCISNSITTDSIIGSAFCQYTSYNVSVPFTTTGIFNGFYTAELSDANGSFANPVIIGSGAASPIAAIIPAASPAGSAYRIRVTNSNPVFAGTDNGSDLSINTCINNTITTGVISGSPFCITSSYNVLVPFTSTGTFSGTFMAELSDASGSFANPVPIGTGTISPISAVIPSGSIASANYLIRVVNSSPAISGTDNGSPLSINSCIAIITDTISGSPFCATTSYNVTVPFTLIGNLGGPFSAQLSDASGSFANPLVIGFSSSSPVPATIPTGTPFGIGYRIRVIENNSGIEGSDNGGNLQINTCVVGITENNDLNAIHIYPNPNNGNFYLVTGMEISEKTDLIVTDIVGQNVYQKLIEGIHANEPLRIEIPENPGVYFITLKHGNEITTARILVE